MSTARDHEAVVTTKTLRIQMVSVCQKAHIFPVGGAHASWCFAAVGRSVFDPLKTTPHGKKFSILGVSLACAATNCFAQILYSSTNSTYTENFDSLGTNASSVWAKNSSVAGWFALGPLTNPVVIANQTGTGTTGTFDNDSTNLLSGNTAWTAIPEPSTYLAAAGLLGLMLWPSRRCIIRDTKKILALTPPMRDRSATTKCVARKMCPAQRGDDPISARSLGPLALAPASTAPAALCEAAVLLLSRCRGSLLCPGGFSCRKIHTSTVGAHSGPWHQ
jgi:hypothetical protein